MMQPDKPQTIEITDAMVEKTARHRFARDHGNLRWEDLASHIRRILLDNAREDLAAAFTP